MSGIIGGAGSKSGLIGPKPVYSGKLDGNYSGTAFETLEWLELVDNYSAMSSGIYTVPITGNYSLALSCAGDAGTASDAGMIVYLKEGENTIGSTDWFGYHAAVTVEIRHTGEISLIKYFTSGQTTKCVAKGRDGGGAVFAGDPSTIFNIIWIGI